MRKPRLFLGLAAGAIFAGLALPASLATATPDDPAVACPEPQADGTFEVEDVDGASTDECNLVGETVMTDDGLSVVVPEAGQFTAISVSVEEKPGVEAPSELMVSVSDEGQLATFDPRAVALDPPSGGPCDQPNWVLNGAKWYAAQLPSQWLIRRSSIPSNLNADNTVAALRDAMQNITNQDNTCNLADNFGKDGNYQGSTTLFTNVQPNAGCPAADGTSVVGWGDLDGDFVGATCLAGFPDAGNDLFHITTADIRLDNTSRTWTLSGGASGCSGVQDVENVATHEFGHWWGLFHATSGNDLTMWPTMANCETKKRTLGAGDVYGLRQVG